MKRLVFLTLLAAIVLTGAALGYRHYKYTHDPLVAGVPPRANADGTYDYTMFWPQQSLTDPHKSEIREWVVRLDPKYVEGSWGNEDMSVSGGGVSFSSKGHPNLGYYVWLHIADLQPTSSFVMGRDGAPVDPQSFSILLRAEKEKSSDATESLKFTLRRECVPLDHEEFGLELYGVGTGKTCAAGQTFYAHWQDAAKTLTDGYLSCWLKIPACDVTVVFDGRRIFGYYPFGDRDQLVELLPRLRKFLSDHTVADRPYTGTPFVYGDGK